MTPAIDRNTASPKPATLEPEREHFQALVLANPNYFGNLASHPLKLVKSLQLNTSYEELVCVGLHPDYDRLEAIVDIKRDVGYGGNVCAAGSREYVRFYVDLHGDGVWHDVGLGEVRVHDIAGAKPLCYAVARRFVPALQLCRRENVIRVLAILSWAVPPPPNLPGFHPVYGNRLGATVQIRPRRSFPWQDLAVAIKEVKDALPPPIAPLIELVEPSTVLPLAAPVATTLAERRELYRGAEVPVHRFAFAEVQHLFAQPPSPATFAGGPSPLLALGLETSEVSALVNQLQLPSSGDTFFEELRCAGLCPAGDVLAATFTIKRNGGYSGGLCTQGSFEHVAFWIDFGDGAGLTYVGTSSVRVHDLVKVPDAGLQYAAFLKTDLGQRLVPCTAGPRVVHLRAILSWAVAPPPSNPDFVPVWGNRRDCLVQLRPGGIAGHVPVIETVGNVGVNDIGPASSLAPGFATGIGVGASFYADQSPFGGAVHITGRIGDPPDNFGGPAARFRYKIEVRPADSPGDTGWHALTNGITVKVAEALNGVPIVCGPGGDIVCDVALTPSDDLDGLGDGWYDYMQDYKGAYTRWLVEDQLGVWWTTSGMEGMWQIRITAKDMATTPPTVYAGPPPPIVVWIDNTAATGDLALTSATFEGKPLPAVGCGKFPVGALLAGTYSVHDVGTSSPAPHFGSFTLTILPTAAAGGASPVPASGSFPTVLTAGEDGTWSLDTAGMEPCGYVLRLISCDRTIYDSGFVGLCTEFDLGFCLEAPAAAE